MVHVIPHLGESRVGTYESLAQRITNETYNWVSDPRWHPSGDMAVATKWYFSSLSLGAGEGWEFLVPAVNAKSLVEAGAGKRLVSKRLPMGWTKADYVEQQCLPSFFNRDLNTGTCVICPLDNLRADGHLPRLRIHTLFVLARHYYLGRWADLACPIGMQCRG
jgi:hypothetical protein